MIAAVLIALGAVVLAVAAVLVAPAAADAISKRREARAVRRDLPRPPLQVPPVPTEPRRRLPDWSRLSDPSTTRRSPINPGGPR